MLPPALVPNPSSPSRLAAPGFGSIGAGMAFTPPSGGPRSPGSGDRGVFGGLGIGSAASHRHEASSAPLLARTSLHGPGSQLQSPRSPEEPSFGHHGLARPAGFDGAASSAGVVAGRPGYPAPPAMSLLGSGSGDKWCTALLPALNVASAAGAQSYYGFRASGGGTGGGQVRDDMSVEFLCRKFEALSDQLRREEAAREAAERRSQELSAEMKGAEECMARDNTTLVLELNASDSSLAALRANADGAGHVAAAQAERVREEHAVNSRLEQRCAQLAEECRNEVVRFDGASARLVAQEREAVHEQCEHAELTRKLRQVQVDMQVSLEDLRIAQQRAMLVKDESQSIERNLEVMRMQSHSSTQEYEAQVSVIADKHLQYSELESRLKELSERVDVAHGDNVSRDRQLVTMQGDEKTTQVQLATVQQEVAALQHEANARSAEVHAESEVNTILHDEFKVVERQRLNDAQETSAYIRRVADTAAAIGNLHHEVEHMTAARFSLSRQMEQLAADEHHHAAAARGLCQTRHAEDIAFEDMQGELQAAFRRKDALAEDLALHKRSRDALLEQLRWLQPEVEEAERRCRHLEQQLATRAREIEEELVQQRHSQEEVAAITNATRRLHRQETELEAEWQLISSAECGQGPEGALWRSRSAAGLADQRPTLGTYSAPQTPSRRAEALSNHSTPWHGVSTRSGWGKSKSMRSISPTPRPSRHHAPRSNGCVRSPSPMPRLGSSHSRAHR